MLRKDTNLLEATARTIRLDILKMAHNCDGPAHLGGGLSMVEIMTALFSNVLRFDPLNPSLSTRDRFILSKGHGVLGYFPVLAHFGYFDKSLLDTFKVDGSDLVAHPVWKQELGIESSNGSLGHGLSMGAGIALAGKIKEESFQTYVLLGDGECNEGSVWEAAMFAAQYKLDNLTAIIDWNGFQSDGPSEEVIDNKILPNRWRGFGWNVIEVDGHNFIEIENALKMKYISSAPKVVLAKTIKGKGISFMENNNDWHHNRLTKSSYTLALNELDSQ
jgi:transketolase